jgi:hypothetical protein
MINKCTWSLFFQELDTRLLDYRTISFLEGREVDSRQRIFFSGTHTE